MLIAFGVYLRSSAKQAAKMKIFRSEEAFLQLQTTVFTVGSVTLAIKAKKLLARDGIASKLVKADASKSAGGCVYGIEFPTKDLYAVANVLRSANVYYKNYEK